MRLCLLGSSYERSTSAFRDHDPPADPSPYGPRHHWERRLLDKATAVRDVIALAAGEFDVFVNLCDGAWDEDRAGIEVVQALERLEQAFTGAGSRFYEPSRHIMKVACHYAGIRTPRAVAARGPVDVERALDTLCFPLIVKHPNSYGSIGMTRQSRVESARQLVIQADRMIGTYGGALIEEFIEGREFTVLVCEPPAGGAEPRTFVPFEVHFPEGETFKHFDLKWVDYERLRWGAVNEAPLEEALRDGSAGLFTALGGDGYARCDWRMSRDGELFALEINPNCGVFYPPGEYGSADMILAADPAGHAGFLEHILDCALLRRQRQERLCQVAIDPRTGCGLYATRDIPAGTVVDRGEEQPHFLVTREWAERTWDTRRRRWFRQYAWPVSERLFVMWSDRPEDWRPIDHSCDPNTWLDGLNLVARRPIARGEAITVDYATFCGPTMEEFACHCGSALCRGVVRGSDHLQPFVGERYGDHVSDYVRRARRTQHP